MIVDALKQAETADVSLVQRIVVRIVAGDDAANDLAVFRRRRACKTDDVCDQGTLCVR